MSDNIPQRETVGTVVERRTLVVWTTLLATMTVVSGLLMWLEPDPLAPAGGLALAATDNGGQRLSAVFDTQPDLRPGRWDRIVIHHSGQMRGDAQSIDRLHRSLNYDGLQYHFVIGNGTGGAEGTIQVGARWMDQQDVVYADRAISICLVGNGDQVPPTTIQLERLAMLVRALQDRLNISSDRVLLHRQLAQTTSPGRLFPSGRFRDMLD